MTNARSLSERRRLQLRYRSAPLQEAGGKAGILSEMKKRQHFEKPSVMRKKKKAAARKRLLKKMRKMNAA